MSADADQANANRTKAEQGLVGALRRSTRDLHRAAERSGIVQEMLQGRIDITGYALYLRNLLPAYTALETALERHRDSPLIGALARREVYRGRSIARDLDRLLPGNWKLDNALLPPALGYAAAIASAGEGDGAKLIAHAYTRYLGDLSGGQILRRILGTSIGKQGRDLAFHEFSEIADLTTFKLDYLAAIDRAGALLASTAPIEQEAIAAFEANIAISLAVGVAAQGRHCPTTWDAPPRRY